MTMTSAGLRRVLLIASAAMALTYGAAFGGDASVPATADFSRSAVVVFVCEHGSSKSLVAAALFNRMAEQRGLSQRAISRAVSSKSVDSQVPARLIQNMSGDGFHVETFQPQALTASEAAGAARVVVINYDDDVDAAANVPVERWGGVPPAGTDYENAKKSMGARIETLLSSFGATGREAK
jgi:arsenate reductase (thioredoxin)